MLLCGPKNVKVETPCDRNTPRSIRVVCKSCNFTATDSSNLKRHIQTVHERSRYSCQYCDKMFTAKNMMKSHIDYKHLQIKHSCEECGKVFTSKTGYSKHIATHQGINYECETLLVPICLYTQLKK